MIEHSRPMVRMMAVVLVVAGALSPALAAEVKIVAPTPGAGLSGEVEIKATVTPRPGEKLDQVVVQTSRGEMVRMMRGFADSHSATLDTTKLGNGRQALLVTASVKGRNASVLQADRDKAWQDQVRSFTAEVEVMVSNPYQFYWGDVHAHTSYSDGAGLPKDAYEYARSKAGLAFFAVTDHSQLLTFEEYQDVIAQADGHDQPGRFAALYGVESTEPAGHICFYMSSSLRLPMKLDDLYRALGESRLLGGFNHPDASEPPSKYLRNDFEGFHYSPLADGAMALVNVRTAGEEAAYIKLLDAGWHVGASGSEDKHDRTWGSGPTWTVALARELTREAVLDAIRARRTYSASDRNLQLTFTVDGEDMGAQIARQAGALSCLVTVSDPDADGIVDLIDLFMDGRVVQTMRPKLTKYAWAAAVDFTPGRHYCFVRVTQVGGHITWSSPVWVAAY